MAAPLPPPRSAPNTAFDCGAAAYILDRPLVRAQPTGARFSSDGDQITAPIYRDRAEV